jgi:phage terminase large subunit-like protein
MSNVNYDPEFERRYQHAIARAREFSASLEGPSLAERFGRLPLDIRNEILSGFSASELARLRYDWATWARPKQDPELPPHRIWFFLGGRGSGKTLAGAQRVRRRVEAGARSIAIVGPTLREIERYQIKGDGGSDGVLTVFPPNKQPEYKPHKALVFFHHMSCPGCSSAEDCGGAIAYINSAEDPEFRGPNLDTCWCDEPAKWRYLSTIWTNIELATRLRGPLSLEIILTGTPLPLQLFRELISDEDTSTVIMSQEENESNLDPGYLARMRRKFQGTRIGRQEREAEILSDNPDALFQASVLDAMRVEFAPMLDEIAVAVDPAIATNPENDETAIIAGGRDAAGHIYILSDVSSRSKPEKWGADVVQACEQHQCDIVVGERNRGGDLVAANVRAAKERKRGTMAAKALKIIEVAATRGKAIRAEPVSALADRGLIHIVGRMPELEAELCEWNPRIGGRSPNRLDAMVWLVWYLARLGEDEKRDPDYKMGFKGLRQASAALRAADRPASASGFASALPRWPGGSKL